MARRRPACTKSTIVQRGLNFVMNALTVQAIAVNNTSVLPNQPAPRDPCVGIPLNMSPCSGLTNTK